MDVNRLCNQQNIVGQSKDWLDHCHRLHSPPRRNHLLLCWAYPAPCPGAGRLSNAPTAPAAPAALCILPAGVSTTRIAARLPPWSTPPVQPRPTSRDTTPI